MDNKTKLNEDLEAARDELEKLIDIKEAIMELMLKASRRLDLLVLGYVKSMKNSNDLSDV